MRALTLLFASLLSAGLAQGQDRIVLRAERLLDGAGNVLENRSVVVAGGSSARSERVVQPPTTSSRA
jgi:hypothetical protein